MGTKIKAIPLIGSIAICFLAGAIGSLFTYQYIPTWYASLNKPFFNPPNWVFGPVWSTLYLMMGVSLYLIWQIHSKKKEKTVALKYFFTQLALNTLWSIVFFGLQAPLPAFIVIICLWIMIFLTIKQSFSLSKAAAWLLVPYLAWVSFASLLNISIVILNR